MPRWGESLKERFWKKVEFVPFHECWEWNANINNAGYGMFYLNGRKNLAHRVSYKLSIGPIPDNHIVRHKCDNRSCIRPEHLETGTHAENTRDMDTRGRRARGFKRK